MDIAKLESVLLESKSVFPISDLEDSRPNVMGTEGRREKLSQFSIHAIENWPINTHLRQIRARIERWKMELEVGTTVVLVISLAPIVWISFSSNFDTPSFGGTVERRGTKRP